MMENMTPEEGHRLMVDPEKSRPPPPPNEIGCVGKAAGATSPCRQIWARALQEIQWGLGKTALKLNP